MAPQNSKRSSRKRGKTSAPRATAPRAVASQRREQRVERMQAADKRRRERQRTLGAVGEPPPNPFGGVPVAELLILAGIVALVVWLVVGGTPSLIVGIVVILAGVLEFTVREHISGFRSHTILLSAIPAVLVAALAITISGERTGDAPMLATAIPVFLLAFFPLRRRFQNARQARVARVAQPPDATGS